MIPDKESGIQMSFYAWRRATGTRVDRKLGIDRARQLLHHSPASTSFRKAYDFGITDIDVFVLAAGEESHISSDLKSSSHVAQTIERRVIDHELFLRNYIAESEEVLDVLKLIQQGDQSDETAVMRKRVERRSRQHAEVALLREEKILQSNTRTVQKSTNK
jgi:hypothetical protein